MESSRFSSDTKYKLRYIPQIFAQGMTGVNRKEFPKQGSGTANFVDGIPSIYSIAPSSGGKYVERADINGIGWLATQMQFFMQCGQFLTFDQDFCNDINGYPKGAILRTALATEGVDGTVKDEQNTYLVMSLVENNTTNFNTDEEKRKIEDGTSTAWKKLSIPYEVLKVKLDSIDAELIRIDEKASKAYHFKGSVPTYDDLPKEANVEGDVWNVTETGDNYAWVEATSEWDTLGKAFDLSTCVKKDDISNTQDTEETGKDKRVYSVAYLNGALADCFKSEKITGVIVKDDAQAQAKVYNAHYVNSLLSGSKIEAGTEENNERGYTARYIDTEFTKYFKTEKISDERVDDVSQSKEKVYSAYYVNEELSKYFKAGNITGEKVDENASEKVYTAKYVNDLEAALVKKVEDQGTALDKAISDKGTSLEKEITDLKKELEEAIATAKSECVAKTSILKEYKDEATDDELYSAKRMNDIVQRLRDVETRLETVESWIHKHGGSSDMEG